MNSYFLYSLLTLTQILNISIYLNTIKAKEYSFREYIRVYRGDPKIRNIIKKETEIKAIEWGKDTKILIIGNKVIHINRLYLLV